MSWRTRRRFECSASRLGKALDRRVRADGQASVRDLTRGCVSCELPPVATCKFARAKSDERSRQVADECGRRKERESRRYPKCHGLDLLAVVCLDLTKVLRYCAVQVVRRVQCCLHPLRRTAHVIPFDSPALSDDLRTCRDWCSSSTCGDEQARPDERQCHRNRTHPL